MSRIGFFVKIVKRSITLLLLQGVPSWVLEYASSVSHWLTKTDALIKVDPLAHSIPDEVIMSK